MPNKSSRALALKYAVILIMPLCALFYPQTLNFATLAFGERVFLETRPVDPSDILRGDYVTLDYEIQDIPDYMHPEEMGGGPYSNKSPSAVFVGLERDTDGVGRVRSVSLKRPNGGLYIKGIYKRMRWGIDYGLSRYYVPEGTGRDIEEKVRDHAVLAEVRIWRGHPVIYGLVFKENGGKGQGVN
ncbi:MAG: GDYXXLXY domain-containing protein [Synergistaceae bacterium]|nr:GDYXXLXY domain-containing protein [Synergistaceae bacterium]